MARIPRMDVLNTPIKALLGLGIGLLIAAVLWWLRDTKALEIAELNLVDVRTRHFVGTRNPDSRIILSVVNENDVRDMAALRGHKWPWPQGEVQAGAPQLLKAAGAKALLLDFLFLDSGKDPSELAEDMRGMWLAQTQLEAEEAQALGASLRDFGGGVVGFNNPRDAIWETPLRRPLALERLAFSKSDDVDIVSSRRLERPKANLPVPGVLAGARLLGLVNMLTDDDGIVRQSAIAGTWGGRKVPTAGAAAASIFVDGEVVFDGGSVRFGDFEQPLSEDGTFLVNFRDWTGDGFDTVYAYDLMDAYYYLDETNKPDTPQDLADWNESRKHALALKDKLEGKIVIYGVNFGAAEDVVATPTSEQYLGPAFHATVIDNLLHGDGRVRVAASTNTLVLFGLCAVLGVFGATTRRRWLPHALPPVVAIGLGWIAFWMFEGGRSIDLVTPWMGILFTWVATSALRLVTEGRRNKWLENTFGRYLSPEVIAALKDDPTRLALGGRRRDLTIFFSDVAGFTSLSEKLMAEEVVLLLNRYLTGQSEEVMSQNGVIDKFEGDAIMAFFGDPLDMPDHAVHGCRAAVRCMNALPKLEPLWREFGLEGFAIRIGLNSGHALVGNMGSERRFDYTCMGDPVNLAARLEGANKAFGSKIMIGPQTYDDAKDHILAKRLADLVVVGKKQAVAVYELVAMADDATDEQRAHVEAFNRAHEAARAGDPAAARAALDEAEAHAPGDGPVAWLRGLVDELEAENRAWDGSYTLDRK